MPIIPTPVLVPDTPGFTGVQTSQDTVAIVSRDVEANDTVLVQATFDGNATKLRLGQILGATLATPVYRNALGHAVIEDPNGNELNGPAVGAS